MRVSRQQAAANRERVLEAASTLFRVNGLAGVSIDDVMKAAGLTHGGFYGQFDSKEALTEEACARGARDSITAVQYEQAPTDGVSDAGSPLRRVLDDYVSAAHRDNPQSRCTVAALAGDAGRASPEVQHVFASAITGMARALGSAGHTQVDDGAAADPDYFLLAGMVGAIVLSRAVREADPTLSDRILTETRERLAACGPDGASPPSGSGH
ncbi:TetR/AcrR family transcriptional repressor of nem operon [Streptomyces aurantiacus]|uniref:TetR/AcrR family transcriptional regulator n=1 Tax=Streptomyces aurantiacus TaxID=47760 RepID=UPI0027929A6D|nr:TetR/AcrR family transcriptional regulator [Streptomyces aurantiacus]MDQ0771753.1 TetR/AcrR family transcriptional repressor of nem operon [Streptomyces aurantiacus]